MSDWAMLLKAGTELAEKVKIGNFVEIKKAKLDPSVSVSHLSYVGDAEIGENVNIGCGFITCNYDGGDKHKTVIGKNSFIGSDTQMIAPVNLGESVFIASGSTINQDVPSKGFAFPCPSGYKREYGRALSQRKVGD